MKGQPLGDTPEQVREDVVRAQLFGADHVFFDMGMVGVPLDDQLRFMERLRAVTA